MSEKETQGRSDHGNNQAGLKIIPGEVLNAVQRRCDLHVEFTFRELPNTHGSKSGGRCRPVRLAARVRLQNSSVHIRGSKQHLAISTHLKKIKLRVDLRMQI